MYERITTNIVKNISKALPEAESLIAKGSSVGDDVIGEVATTLERSPKVDGFVKEVTGSVSPSVSTVPVNKIKSVIPLNRESYCSNFFGVTSPESIQQKLHNQMALTWFKTEEQHISNIAGITLDLEYPYTLNQSYLNKTLASLFESGLGRLTMEGKVFGGEEATHTIGFVFDKKNNIMYVLDSLPKEVQSQYRNSLVKILTNNRDVKIVFSSKPQQQMNEYTCNNWTHANIEAVQCAIKDGKILGEDELNSILPNDINEILKSQRSYLVDYCGTAYYNLIKQMF